MNRRIVAVAALVATSAAGQQAIISMPSADITRRGSFFFMHETQLRSWGGQPYWAGTYFLTYGVTEDLEVAATVFDLGRYHDGSLGTSVAAVGLKGNLRLAPGSPLRPTVTLGAMALASLVGLGGGTWLYAIGSVVVPVVGTRVAGGLSYAGDPLYGKGQETFSAIASIEQPVPGVRGLSLVAEWFSGSHELSNLIVGATYHPDRTWIFVVGWKIPTKDLIFSLEEQAFVAEVGVFFPPIGGGSADDDHH